MRREEEIAKGGWSEPEGSCRSRRGFGRSMIPKAQKDIRVTMSRGKRERGEKRACTRMFNSVRYWALSRISRRSATRTGDEGVVHVATYFRVRLHRHRTTSDYGLHGPDARRGERESAPATSKRDSDLSDVLRMSSVHFEEFRSEDFSILFWYSSPFRPLSKTLFFCSSGIFCAREGSIDWKVQCDIQRFNPRSFRNLRPSSWNWDNCV